MIDFKNLNIRLTILSLIIFITAFLFNDPFRFFDSSYETSGQLVAIKSISDVDALEIWRNNISLYQLKKTEKGWTVKDTPTRAEFDADSSKIEQAIQRIIECRKYYEVTNKPEKFKEYELEDNSLVVEIKHRNNSDNLIIGKQGATFNTSLVRLKQSKTVYSVRGNLSSDWNQDVEFYRNKKFFAFTRDNMKSVIASGPQNYEIYVGENNEWLLKQGNITSNTNSAKINRLLDEISLLEGMSFYHDLQEGIHYASINVMLSSNISFNLIINKVGKEYIVKSDANPFWQTVSEHRVNTLFPKIEELKSAAGGAQ